MTFGATNVEPKRCTYDVNLTYVESADWTSTSTRRQSDDITYRLRSTFVSPKVSSIFEATSNGTLKYIDSLLKRDCLCCVLKKKMSSRHRETSCRVRSGNVRPIQWVCWCCVVLLDHIQTILETFDLSQGEYVKLFFGIYNTLMRVLYCSYQLDFRLKVEGWSITDTNYSVNIQ